MDPRSLREATRAEHEATEAVMPLMEPALELEVYVRVLQVLFPLLRGWEEWVDGAAPGKLRGMLQSRRRSHLLLADLQVFGAGPAETEGNIVDWGTVITGCVGGAAGNTGEKDFEARLLGAVYVMEGSTLGGRFLARHLEATLGLAPGVGDSYFQGHGEDTAGMWREVLEWIRAVPDEKAPSMIASAKQTFAAFGETLRTGLYATQMQHD